MSFSRHLNTSSLEYIQASALQTVAGVALDLLGLSVAGIAGPPQVKVTRATKDGVPMAVRPYEMMPLTKPVVVVEDKAIHTSEFEIAIYVVADTLRVARINTVSCEWYMFREHVSTDAA